MRLERLEINGFKSFSDRSELAFDKGVTAIVGPNGCGKSNVADAITWVMGEQSAKSLRGDTMEDVIFNGSDARKPTAAAEVRLRFTGVLKTVTGPAFPGVTRSRARATAGTHGNGNGNGNGTAMENGHGNGNGALARGRSSVEELIQSVAREVEVTRRLYRSGESEYLIDGQTCRLRDVHDLLMDTGLGAKAYAIIEQGKIGMILSSRPTDRRQLIEEAAGVTKYKARRRAAELKLEAAQQNLTRVDDIVFEVEKQRGTLKRQAAKARRYQKLRDELRRWEKVLFARKYRQLAETIESARGRLADAREREAVGAGAGRRRSKASSAGCASRWPRPRRARPARAKRRMPASSRSTASSSRSPSTANRSLALDDASRGHCRRGRRVEARREPAQTVLAGRRDGGARRRCRAGSARRRGWPRNPRRTKPGTARSKASRPTSRPRAARCSPRINSATALRHALEHAGAARDRVAETLAKLSVEADDVRIESERAAADRAAAADSLRRAHEAIEATRIAGLARESELASARIEHEWRARSVRAQEQALAGLEARLTSLEELEAARAAYGDAPRAVLAQANGKVNQQGAVADYLEVEAGYERAVEAYLGDLLQHVIVERPEHARPASRSCAKQARAAAGS